jgi:acetyl-CoA carboxylase biotin carboxyl carrier protein
LLKSHGSCPFFGAMAWRDPLTIDEELMDKSNEIPGQESAPGRDDWAAHVELLQGLAQLVQQEKLSELELEQDGVKMTLRSFHAAPPAVPGFAPVAGATALPYADEWYIEEEQAPATGNAAPGGAGAGLVPVVAPMVGMFYRAQSPDDPPFVEVGDHVESGQIIGLVEAMKTFNEIMSDVSGTVREVVVSNGALVETGAPLIMVEKG